MKPAKPPSTTPDGRIVRLVMPKAVEEAKAIKGKPAQSGNVTTSAQVIHRHAGRRGPLREGRKRGERIDWDGMEPLFRANKLTLTELAEMFGVAVRQISYHAKEHGWTRDMSERIDAVAEDMVNRVAAGQHPTEPTIQMVNGKPREVTTEVVVAATAQLIANVRLTQRERFKELGRLGSDMFAALREQFEHRAGLAELGELMERRDDNGNLDAISKRFREVIELPGQVKVLRDLTEVIAKLTAMESVAYKLDKAPDGTDNSRTSLPVRFVEPPPMVERLEEGEDDD